MTRFIADQNKVVLLHESGTYANTSGNGYWIGQVISNSVDDQEGKIEDRFLGASTRSFVSVQQGPRDVKGTLEYYPQDMRIPFWAIGSVVDTSGTNFTHLSTQINTNVWQSPFTSGTGQLSAPISFTLEDSKTSPGTGTNFVRTIKGCVPDTVTITATKGEKVKVGVDYIGQTLNFSSGTTTSVTAGSNTPYLWNNCTLQVNGSILDTTSEIVMKVKNNLKAPHYLNGSRDISVPYPENRENTMDITLDLDGNDSDMLYNTFYKTNTQFNSTFDLNADSTTGSQHTILYLSGCRINKMENPSIVTGTVVSKVSVIAPIVIGSSFDRIGSYNPF